MKASRRRLTAAALCILLLSPAAPAAAAPEPPSSWRSLVHGIEAFLARLLAPIAVEQETPTAPADEPGASEPALPAADDAESVRGSNEAFPSLDPDG